VLPPSDDARQRLALPEAPVPAVRRRVPALPPRPPPPALPRLRVLAALLLRVPLGLLLLRQRVRPRAQPRQPRAPSRALPLRRRPGRQQRPGAAAQVPGLGLGLVPEAAGNCRVQGRGGGVRRRGRAGAVQVRVDGGRVEGERVGQAHPREDQGAAQTEIDRSVIRRNGSTGGD
jgi:hypothetical protein